MKLGVENIAEPNNISDFSEALTRAFETLEKVYNIHSSLIFSFNFELYTLRKKKLLFYFQYREHNMGAMCNQAIMLVTDGVPENFYELFKNHNWKNGTMGMPVRVFTYLIGREVPEIRDMKWMACANHGKYLSIPYNI